MAVISVASELDLIAEEFPLDHDELVVGGLEPFFD